MSRGPVGRPAEAGPSRPPRGATALDAPAAPDERPLCAVAGLAQRARRVGMGTMTAAELAARLGAKRSGQEWIAHCPVHDDPRASFNFRDGRLGGIVLLCRAGCSTATILAALGLTLADACPTRH